MRVIAGSAKHLPLKTVEGMDTRPTTDRIKETLFNILQNRLPGCYFLDLFAGSGAIGIEALSRGAASCDFVEMSSKAASCIRENLQKTQLEEKARLYTCDVFSYLQGLQTKQRYDIIFMDPPYRKEYERKVLECLRSASYVDEDTLIITEASLDTEFAYLEEYGFELVRVKKYKTNQHIFVQKTGQV